ncbi:hypothetical protein M569_09818 [Genlisea aurea]|uniref:Major facilitator superfamily (MFS) profile domain-containing protein n=1 Tax=Genlisea aurea TaxID=192259 RepID=S8DYD7_9LAMI|nr:hypothetical protein M569_09818 [Genlisea aurea]
MTAANARRASSRRDFFSVDGLSAIPLWQSRSGRELVKAGASSAEGDRLTSGSELTQQAEVFAWSSVLLPFLFPALGGLLFGYDIGATSGATISLQSPELSGTNWFNLSAVQIGSVVCFKSIAYAVLV